MDTQSVLTKSSLPLWVENYPTGYINMKNQNITKFKPDILKYNYAAETTRQLIKSGNNLGIQIPSIMTKKKFKTTALNFENFSQPGDFKERFILPQSYVNPIWIIIIFLISIWVIYFLSK